MGIQIAQEQTQILKTTLSLRTTKAISLLQYSSQELASYLQEEQLKNPLIDWEPSTFQETHTWKQGHSSTADPLDFVCPPTTLSNYLLDQLYLEDLSPREKEVATYIIYSLDDYGYLKDTVENIAMALTEDVVLVKKVLGIIHTMDPLGVGASSLQECLLIQMRTKPVTTKQMMVLEHCFEAFALKNWGNIVKQLSISKAEIQKLQEIVVCLDPKPGQAYNETIHYVIPDYKVTVKDNYIELEPMQEFSTNIKLNRFYQKELNDKSGEEVKFLSEKFKDYKWLAEALQYRELTIDKVVKKLIEKQRLYFYNGPKCLRPLTMKEIAEEIHVHESTVSRCVKNKFIETPFGTIRLNSFFQHSFMKQDGTFTSTENVKQTIVSIIEQEDKTKPYSDQKIGDQLQKMYQHSISRRTVANYRDQLNILPAKYRKVY